MARTWQYPRWRRLLMQAAMWLVLAATIGLAALVDREKSAGRAAVMGPRVEVGTVSLKLPLGWHVGNEAAAWGMLNATEPSRRADQRVLYVTAVNHWDGGDIEQLLRHGMESTHSRKRVPGDAAPDENTPSGDPPQGMPRQLRTFTMTPRNYPQQSLTFGSGSASTSGPLLVQDRTVEDDNGDEAVVYRQVIGTAAMPTVAQVTLRLVHLSTQPLSGVGEVEDDLELIKQIAATVAVGPGGQ